MGTQREEAKIEREQSRGRRKERRSRKARRARSSKTRFFFWHGVPILLWRFSLLISCLPCHPPLSRDAPDESFRL